MHNTAQDIVELTPEQYATAGIQLGTIEHKVMHNILRVQGMLDVPPQNVVAISPHIGGYVQSTPLLQGLRVRKGQIIAILEHQDIIALQQDFLETRSRLEFAEAEFQRQEALQRDNINALKALQQVTAEYKSLKARYAALRQRLALIGIHADSLHDYSIQRSYAIRSPIDGYVTDVPITLGKFVSPHDILCCIVNPSHIHAELTVFEHDAPKIRVGQRVRLVLSNEAHERTAKVYLIGREISPERTIRVHAHLDREDESLLPNTTLSAAIELDNQSVLAVPDEALVNINGTEYIFTPIHQLTTSQPFSNTSNSRQYSFRRIAVQRGITIGGWTELRALPQATVPPVTLIVVKGAYTLASMFSQNSDHE
ncbi:MAG: efflux RND transporter periplasmic adaptor subunit [Candidatus Kapabacteria bacterium]|nr:efflux RND transporter periplasmic adaptor subunit [Candidatus Kapabacteria bacterium]